MADSILQGRSLSVRDQEHLLRENNSLVARAKKAAMEHKVQLDQIKETAAAIVTGGLFGYVEGKYPARAQAANVPISAWGGAALIAYAVSGYAGDMADLVLAAGEGAASYAAGMAAYKRGQKSAAAA